MSRALRFSPPVANAAWITRPRLLAQLRTRFERRVTAIVAPAGFGKTTLLAQAIRENEFAPLGDDLWLTCQPDDESLTFLAGAVFEALGASSPIPEQPEQAALAVADAMWALAPQDVALILDDAHLIEPISPGGRFLSGLLSELPRNGHLVLACRPPLKFRTARLRAGGEAILLDENDMQFRSDEVEAFAQSHGASKAALNEVGGWPALVELTASVGPQAVEGYVWEELLSQLAVDVRDALAMLVVIGGADDEIASAVLGKRVELSRLLAGLPLVVRAGSGWHALHPLWSAALQHELPADRIASAQRAAGLILARRRIYHDAMDLFLAAQAWADARRLIVEVCEVCTPLVPPDVLDVWLRKMPDEVKSAPEGSLLAAMVAEPRHPEAATQLLTRTLEHATDVGVRYACMNALVQLAFWRSDRRAMQRLAQQLLDLGPDGPAEAPAWVALLSAVLARDPDDTWAALASPHLMAGAHMNPIQDWLHAHIVLCKLGAPDSAEPLARRALAHQISTMQAVSRSALAESLRLRGRTAELQDMLPDVLADLNPVKLLTSPELLTSAVVELCVLGRQPQAGDLLDRYRTTVESSPVSWARIAVAIADAFQLATIGDDVAAGKLLDPMSQLSVGRSQTIVQVSCAALPLVYVLVASLRPVWDETPPPGHFATALALSRALVQLREGHSLDGVRGLTADERAVMAATLPPPWVTELAVALVAIGRPEGRVLLEEQGRAARDVLRGHVTDPRSPIAGTARTLLRELPPTPSFTLELRTLGSLELYRDGVLVLAPELRRERVRQLLAYLVTHGRVTRAAITAQLWPDLDDAASGRNLRVTLAYLQQVFEPDRADLDPPYFVRTFDGSLQIVADETLRIDVRDLERDLDEGNRLEQQGAMTTALGCYERALEIWRGEFFAELNGGDWLLWERDRLRGRFVATALRAANLELARGDMRAAQHLAERALGVDEWSEPAYQVLISAALGTGDIVGARRVLDRCRAALHELGVEPNRRTLILAAEVTSS